MTDTNDRPRTIPKAPRLQNQAWLDQHGIRRHDWDRLFSETRCNSDALEDLILAGAAANDVTPAKFCQIVISFYDLKDKG